MFLRNLSYTELTSTIEFLRKEMVSCGLKDGFTNEKTIQISQLLDTHIAQYHVNKVSDISTFSHTS
ncbi:MAG: aspartyl-phosphate phosphatase Spo0E family protein [Bacillus sp. (in: Bacteria)]|nr:aspartyl-phosphate phosphatase Spo0E family protein [Bacillus sp. (in: firmicutes)]